MIVTRSIRTPARDIDSLDFFERFGTEELGLITSWEIGRRLATRSPEVADAALRGELPELPWKGGVTQTIKKTFKYGALNYLAQYQGLRSEDLNINTDDEVSIVCAKNGLKVVFTNDHEKLKSL